MSSVIRTEQLANGKVTKEVLREGSGPTPASGKNVTVHYVGTLDSGKKFDSSRDSRSPFKFALGTGSVIKGWDVGVATMKKGELCNLVIAPEYAYKDQEIPGLIPANSRLHFEVELLDF
eukprot:Gregarina_sp_Pseudo_9__3915@NODE_4058_length_496_cov_339_328228_g3729_i0_p1_GENE_NODE_4058_length_496_cov_339_328228_g3729_i0NODE_4058_length_496_cov_339_328228_g3729_i0_p1_ORF_typecomplete_len119_score20_62FKBP_C/PF00254_28/1_4e30FKBP_N_2/PF18023_1/0_0094_NODE_4058_length_496_cov_339_328228_g3729_i077433